MNQRVPSVLLSTLLNIRKDQRSSEKINKTAGLLCFTLVVYVFICFCLRYVYTGRGGVIYSQFEVSLELTV